MKSVAGTSMMATTAPSDRPTTKGWMVDNLVELGPRMQPIPRVSAVADSARLAEIIKEYEDSGVPLIIEDWNKTPNWPGNELFGFDWLLEHVDELLAVRDCVSLKDREIMFKEFVEMSRAISAYTEDDEGERLYGKDAVCPKEWRDWLMDSDIPEVLKPGSSEDVLELLPVPERVETLMCYYGIGDTFTAAHKDLCASSGQNLMCSAERGGSAFWFMTRSSDAPKAASYFQKLGSELDHEAYVASPKEFAQAPFMVYIAEQRVGDLVLVPRRSCHQVVNNGGLAAKMSWSRMTVEGLSIAFHHELPLYRRVCRSETYRVKLLVYRTLLKYTRDLEEAQRALATTSQTVPRPPRPATNRKASFRSQLFSLSPLTSPNSSQTSLLLESQDDTLDTLISITPEHDRLLAIVRKLLIVYDKIFQEEHSLDTQCEMHLRSEIKQKGSPHNSPTVRSNMDLEGSHSARYNGTGETPIPINEDLYFDGLTCDFCGADIFLSFFECQSCTSGDSRDDGIVVCPSCYVEGRSCTCTIMKPVQQFPVDLLLEVQNKAQKLLNFEGYRKESTVVKVVALSHQAVDKLVQHPGIFSAACQLLRIRKGIILRQKKTELSCRLKIPHIVAAAAALSCNRCHSSRCFKHILTWGHHVADAIKLYIRDDTHSAWHKLHIGGRQRLLAARHAVEKAQETGEPCDMSVNLVLFAQEYTYCRPMTDKVIAGWYDDTPYIEVESSIEFHANDFADTIFGDEDIDLVDTSSSSETSSSDYFALTSKNPARPRKIVVKAAPRPPSSVPYILLRKLTLEEQSKYTSMAAAQAISSSSSVATSERMRISMTPEHLPSSGKRVSGQPYRSTFHPKGMTARRSRNRRSDLPNRASNIGQRKRYGLPVGAPSTDEAPTARKKRRLILHVRGSPLKIGPPSPSPISQDTSDATVEIHSSDSYEERSVQAIPTEGKPISTGAGASRVEETANNNLNPAKHILPHELAPSVQKLRASLSGPRKKLQTTATNTPFTDRRPARSGIGDPPSSSIEASVSGHTSVFVSVPPVLRSQKHSSMNGRNELFATSVSRVSSEHSLPPIFAAQGGTSPVSSNSLSAGPSFDLSEFYLRLQRTEEIGTEIMQENAKLKQEMERVKEELERTKAESSLNYAPSLVDELEEEEEAGRRTSMEKSEDFDQVKTTRSHSQIDRIPVRYDTIPGGPPRLQSVSIDLDIGPATPSNSHSKQKKSRWAVNPEELHGTSPPRGMLDDRRKVEGEHSSQGSEINRSDRVHRQSNVHEHYNKGAKFDRTEHRRGLLHTDIDHFKRRRRGGPMVGSPSSTRIGREEEDPFLPDEFALGTDIGRHPIIVPPARSGRSGASGRSFGEIASPLSRNAPRL